VKQAEGLEESRASMAAKPKDNSLLARLAEHKRLAHDAMEHDLHQVTCAVRDRQTDRQAECVCVRHRYVQRDVSRDWHRDLPSGSCWRGCLFDPTSGFQEHATRPCAFYFDSPDMLCTQFAHVGWRHVRVRIRSSPKVVIHGCEPDLDLDPS
jgi:hypothetical protein